MLKLAVLLFVILVTCYCLGQMAMAQNAPISAAPLQRNLKLEACRLPALNENVRCGTYEVYEDRRAKTGRVIALRIVVLPARSEKPAPDPVFYFAGGPGGSAVELVTRSGGSYLAELRRERDLVLVDQRGTGGSNPLICQLQGDKNDMAAFFGEIFSIERVRACRTELEKVADLKLYSTSIAMDDLDDVRAALGYDKINLYGGSYGTTAAMAYLRQYPQHVRTATLLGVAPPDMKLPLPFAKGVQNALDHVFADCAAVEKCRMAFPQLKADLDAAVKRLEKESATLEAINPFTRQPQKVTLTREAFGEAIRVMLYTPEFSRWLPVLIHQAAQGDYPLFVSVTFQSMRSLDDLIARGMHFSVVCPEDLQFITDDEAKRELAGTFYGEYRWKAYRKVCEIWPRANIPTSFINPVKADAPVLLITGEADPVTPPWLAAAAARHLSASRHITVPHTGHSFSFPCVDNLIATFVARGSAKDLDSACLTQITRPPFITEEMLAAARNRTTTGNAPKGPEELWQGMLDTGATKLRLVLKLSKTADGKLTGQLDSPDQGANGLSIDSITWQESTVRFEMGLLNAVYEGKLNGDGTEVMGNWRQGGLTLPLNFKRAK